MKLIKETVNGQEWTNGHRDSWVQLAILEKGKKAVLTA
jgi:hypothetical protein